MAFIVRQPPAPVAGSYSTNFPLTEDPISEGGRWINGFTTGLDWNDCRTTGGLATLSAVDHQTGDFNDQTALLVGAWAPNVRVTAVAKHNPVATVNFRELELRVRSTLSAHVNSGYEINFGIGALGPYIQVVRWNGPHGSFDFVNSGLAGAPLVGDGDVCRVDCVGNLITVFVNNVQVATPQNITAIGAHFDAGNPGMGFYNNISTAYGWKSFAVQEL